MTDTVRVAMREFDAKRALEHVGSTTGEVGKTRARADDYFARFEGVDGWHLLHLEMPQRALGGRQRQRSAKPS
jgi:hypothetical protein